MKIKSSSLKVIFGVNLGYLCLFSGIDSAAAAVVVKEDTNQILDSYIARDIVVTQIVDPSFLKN